MMFYRYYVLLSLIQINNNSLEKTRLQKLLFLFCIEKTNSPFHFIPYKYGCFSLQANSDLNKLKKMKLISDTIDNSIIKGKWGKTKSTNYINHLLCEDKEAIIKLKEKFSKYSTSELIRYTYLNYPYYACRSLIKDRILKELRYSEPQISFDDTPKLFTIGYEGKTIEQFLNVLIKNNVLALIDVRSNPFSMKYGFSKNQLKNFCEKININYIHLPSLGIPSEFRKNINNEKSRSALLQNYNLNIQQNHVEQLNELRNIIIDYKRVALNCFESDYKLCHRGQLSQIMKTQYIDYPLVHLC